MACSRTIPARSILSDNSPLACLERGEAAAACVRFHKRNKTLETAMIGANWEGKGGKQEESCGGWVGRGCIVSCLSRGGVLAGVRARQQTKDCCHGTKLARRAEAVSSHRNGR